MMIKHCWIDGILLHDTKAGVMKMVPKKANMRLIKDWRPLTMLSIVYKLIAKLLANKISPRSMALISPQQTRFIPRWFILENISIAWLTHDWATYHHHPTLFFKVSFKKGIWPSQTPLYLGGPRMTRVRKHIFDTSPRSPPLAITKVHINARFIDEILVTCGVQQGFPSLHSSLLSQHNPWWTTYSTSSPQGKLKAPRSLRTLQSAIASFLMMLESLSLPMSKASSNYKKRYEYMSLPLAIRWILQSWSSSLL